MPQMKRYLILTILLASVLFKAIAHTDADPVLMTINGEDVFQSEFEYLYHKNNIQVTKQYSIDEFLDMFIVYRLKVVEAEAAGIDTTATFRNEFTEYCRQLALPYLSKYNFSSGVEAFGALSEKEPVFRNVMNEYRNGILLFEISNRHVWEKSISDANGRDNYFRTHKNDYLWNEPHYKGYIVYAINDSLAKEANRFLQSRSIPSDSLRTTISKAFGKDVKIERTVAGKGEHPVVDHIAFGGKYPEQKGRWKAWFGYQGRIIDTPEEASDVHAQLTADYQEHLEENWVNELRGKYNVKINQHVVDRLKAELKQ